MFLILLIMIFIYLKKNNKFITEGLEEPCKKKDLGDGVYSFEYYPTTPGNYIITITWGGQHIPRRLEYLIIVLVIGPNSKMAKNKI